MNGIEQAPRVRHPQPANGNMETSPGKPIPAEVASLARFVLHQSTPLILEMRNPERTPNAQRVASASVGQWLQHLKNTFLSPHEGMDQFERKLRRCTGEIRSNTEDILSRALSLDPNCFPALFAASNFLKTEADTLPVITPEGPKALSKVDIERRMLYLTTGDSELLASP